MNFRKLIVSGIWLGMGLGVMGLSLWHGQQAAVWARSGKRLDTLADHDHPKTTVEEVSMADKLPKAKVMPGEVEYPVKVVGDWLWWRLGETQAEKGRRLLYLANERLRSGWELSEKGKTSLALETLMKAEGYLTDAIESEDMYQDGVWKKELLDSAQLHYALLSDLEKTVPEEVRPRVTELLNVPKLMAVK